VTPIVDDFIGATSAQTFPSPLAFHRDLLVQSTGGELWFLDSMTMTRIAGFVLAHRHFCILQDGAVAAFVLPPDSSRCELHKIDASRKLDVFKGPVFGSAGAGITHVLPAGSPDEVYVTRQDEIVLFRMAKGEAEEVAQINPSPSGPVPTHLLSLGDGRLVSPMYDGFHVIVPGKAAIEYETPDRYPGLLAAASGGRIWYSHSTATWEGHLVLAPLTNPASVEHTIDFAPGKVIHLASGGGAVAVLVFGIEPGPRGIHAAGALTWTVVVIDENGTERWRADVTAEFPGNDGGFVAISEHRVILRGSNHALLAWDAATGRRIN